MPKLALVVPRDELIKEGFIPKEIKDQALYYELGGNDLEKLFRLVEKYGTYRERGGKHDVEKDRSMQQLIIYGYIQLIDGRFMLYQRGTKVYSEDRLAGKVSLGIGGHMEPTDLSLMDAFYREFVEETIISCQNRPLNFRKANGTTDIQLIQQYITAEPVGLIKDERDDVGKVHLGIICKLIPRTDVHISIHPENGKNIRSFYVTTTEYDALVQQGEIIPEGWTKLVVGNELRGKTA